MDRRPSDTIRTHLKPFFCSPALAVISSRVPLPQSLGHLQKEDHRHRDARCKTSCPYSPFIACWLPTPVCRPTPMRPDGDHDVRPPQWETRAHRKGRCARCVGRRHLHPHQRVGADVAEPRRRLHGHGRGQRLRRNVKTRLGGGRGGGGGGRGATTDSGAAAPRRRLLRPIRGAPSAGTSTAATAAATTAADGGWRQCVGRPATAADVSARQGPPPTLPPHSAVHSHARERARPCAPPAPTPPPFHDRRAAAATGGAAAGAAGCHCAPPLWRVLRGRRCARRVGRRGAGGRRKTRRPHVPHHAVAAPPAPPPADRAGHPVRRRSQKGRCRSPPGGRRGHYRLGCGASPPGGCVGSAVRRGCPSRHRRRAAAALWPGERVCRRVVRRRPIRPSLGAPGTPAPPEYGLGGGRAMEAKTKRTKKC